MTAMISATMFTSLLFPSIIHQAADQASADKEDCEESAENTYHNQGEIGSFCDKSCVDCLSIAPLLKEGFDVVQAVCEHVLSCSCIFLVYTGFDA